MYLINGIDPLTLGWELQESSKIIGSASARRSGVRIPGRNGTVKTKGTIGGEPFALVFLTPVDGFARLARFMRGPELIIARPAAPDIILDCEWVSTGHEELLFANLIKATFLLNAPGVFFRDREAGDYAIAGAGTVMAESTAPVQDAVIRIAGAGTPVSFTSREHSIVYAPVLPAGSYLRVDTATERAWITDTNTWVGGVEVSTVVQISPDFELLPDPITEATPATATGGAAIVRGRRAYDY